MTETNTPRRKLRVLFRVQRSGSFKGEITAVFPSECFDYTGYEMTCWDNQGGHSGCRKAWYRETRPAKPEEYAEALASLRRIYENPDDEPVELVIGKRITAADDKERARQARAYRAAVRENPAGAPLSPEARSAALAPEGDVRHAS